MGSLLRVRDVQALNRSFRHLAEVQAALLDHLRQVEEERRARRPWLAPLLAAAGLALGLGLGILGLALWERSRPAEAVQVQLPPLEIPAPRVDVQVPATGLDAEDLERWRREEAAARAEERQRLLELTERLLEREQETLRLLQVLGTRPSGAAAGLEAEAPAAGAATPAAEPAAKEGRAEASPAETAGLLEAEDPWLGALNGLLASDGYHRLRFTRGQRREGAPVLEDVTLLEWGEDDLLDGLVKAAEAEFELHRMTATLVLRLRDGYRRRGSTRLALPPGGTRIDLTEVNVAAWLAHWPELARDEESATPLAEAVQPVRNPAVEAVRQAVDELLARPRSYGYYRLTALGDLEGGRLRLVQIPWYDAGGRLVKTLEADSLEIRLHPTGTVELLLRDGAILEGGRRLPFYEDRYRLYLPGQDLEAWRAAGAPYVEAGSGKGP